MDEHSTRCRLTVGQGTGTRFQTEITAPCPPTPLHHRGRLDAVIAVRRLYSMVAQVESERRRIWCGRHALLHGISADRKSCPRVCSLTHWQCNAPKNIDVYHAAGAELTREALNVGPKKFNATNGSTISGVRFTPKTVVETQPVGIGTGSLHPSFVVQTRKLSVKFKQF